MTNLMTRFIVGVGGRDDDAGGFAALELVILVPFIIAMMLLVVAFGRVTRGHQLVEQAAQSAARAGSQAPDADTAVRSATAVYDETLANGGVSCQAKSKGISVDVSDFVAGGQITVTVSCVADLADVALSGVPGSLTMTASSTAPVDTYRQLG
jgi:Flp pilus assembly protein TadG